MIEPTSAFDDRDAGAPRLRCEHSGTMTHKRAQRRELNDDERERVIEAIDAIAAQLKGAPISEDRLAAIAAEYMTDDPTINAEILSWVRMSIVARESGRRAR